MKKPTAKLNTAAGLAWDRWVLALLLLGIINQGSYFPGGIVSIVGVLAFCCIVKRVSLGVKHLPFLLFCGWFLFCSVQNGFVIEYTAMGLLPASAFLFYLLVTQTVADRQRFLQELVKRSAVIAVLAVTVTLFRSLGSLSLQRATFPFGYANREKCCWYLLRRQLPGKRQHQRLLWDLPQLSVRFQYHGLHDDQRRYHYGSDSQQLQ